jgi:hypothetical protein
MILTDIQEEALRRMVTRGDRIIDNGRVEWPDGTLPPKRVLGWLLRKGCVKPISRRMINDRQGETVYAPTAVAYEYFGETKVRVK